MRRARRTMALVRLRSTARTRRRPVRPEPVPSAPSAMPSGGAPSQRPRRLPRRASLRIAIIAFVLLLLGGAATAVALTMPSVDAERSAVPVADSAPTLAVRIEHPRGVRADRVDARIDGERIDVDRIRVSEGGARVEIVAPTLADGTHEVQVAISQVGLLRRTVRTSWSIDVDTTAPAANILQPRPADDSAYVAPGVAEVGTSKVALTVGAEAGSTLSISSSSPRAGKPAQADAVDGTRRAVDVTLPEGPQVVTVVATDAAGNETRRRLRVLVDTVGPVMTIAAPPVVKTAALDVEISGRDPHGVDLSVQLDGQPIDDAVTVQTSTPAPFEPGATAGDEGSQDPAGGGDVDGAAAETTEAAAGDAAGTDADEADEADGDDTAIHPVAGTWKVSLPSGAYEGRHVLTVVATDAAGKASRSSRAFIVDSSETLGDSTGLRGGARGADVGELHQALITQGSATAAALGAELGGKVYGKATRDAVQKFQTQRGMEADGVAGSDTIAALTLKIVIDRGAHTLTLFRVGKVVKSWGVAVGSPKYPTPAGSFEIQTKEKNPTWTPPDSEWAKDAEVTPPGPDNPLGTRWMSIDGPIGIHGTNSPTSIGGSVSHGCIRMHIPDVEELFEMVSIGTPVTVV